MIEKYIGRRYRTEGERGYVFEKDGEEVFMVYRTKACPREIRLQGFGYLLRCGKAHKGNSMIRTGEQWFIENMNGYACGFYQYVDLWNFTMSMGAHTAAVIRSGREWLIRRGTEAAACILSAEEERSENRMLADEMGETCFQIVITETFEKELYPLLFAIPVLGF